MSFRTQAPELLQQTAAENAERQVDLEEAGGLHFFSWKRQVFSILFLCFHFELRTPTTWHSFVVAVCLMNTYTTESPTCLANHEARARTHQTEEEYKELQVGPCV